MDVKEAINAVSQFKNVFKAAERLEEALKTYSHAEDYMKKLQNDQRRLELTNIQLTKDINRLDEEYHRKVKTHDEDISLKRQAFKTACEQMDAELYKKRQSTDINIKKEEERYNRIMKEHSQAEQKAQAEREAAEQAAQAAKRHLDELRNKLSNVG